MTTAPIPPITATVSIAVPIEQAFAVFTGTFDRWWPRQYHIGKAEVAEIVLEPHERGRWFERGVDGTECDWGRVLAWEPPDRLLLTWQINGAWQFEPDPDRASEVEVRFTAEHPGHTTVEVEHRHFERMDDGQAVRDAIRGGGGWALLLDGFAKSLVDRL